LKSALAPYVPKEILYRPKQGFAVPLAAWFRGPLRRRVRDRLCGPVLRHSGLFDMESLLDQHQAGERDHSAALWTLSMMEAFLRQVYSGGEQPAFTSETAESVA
jgi:asparagine synthase (glutamine-hydrolysing)